VRRLIARATIAGLSLVALVTNACTSSGQSSPTPTTQDASAVTSPSTSSAPGAPLVGRWEQVHQCQDLVTALDKANLAAMIPQEVNEYFPDESVQQLAQKTDPCAGAKPFRHSHFFDELGQFGSLDQNLNQVDDGQYTIVNAHTFRIGSSTFHYHVINGETLTLDPVITPAERREGLADPLKFSTASWMMSVAYPGTTWNRVPCDGWC
jgi:hypothetical protein